MFKKLIKGFLSDKSDEKSPPIVVEEIYKEIDEYFDKYGSLDFESIPDNILDELNEDNFDSLVKGIQTKINENKKLFHYQYYLVKSAIRSQNGHPKLNDITRIDLQGYYPFYEKAIELKKDGQIKKSANVLCYNIIVNGTDAPGHYTELFKLLRSLEEYQKELVLAKLYLKIFDRGEKENEKTLKRIENIKRLISKKK